MRCKTLAEIVQHERKRTIGVSSKIVHVVANLLKEKEDLSRICSVRSKDGYSSAAPIRSAITAQQFCSFNLGEKILSGCSGLQQDYRVEEVRTLRELRRCENVPNACC